MSSHFVMVHKGGTNSNSILTLPAGPFNGAYYGNLISINEHVDMIFEAGETLTLEMGARIASAMTTSGTYA
jgi:hypothetical protein